MLTPPDILFCLTGDIRQNSRALRQIDALAERGVSVVGLGIADAPSQERHAEAVELVHLERPRGAGPKWFWKIHRLFLREASSRPARLFHASDLFALPALVHAATHETRVSFDSRELYPHVGATAGKPWASMFWGAIERRYIPRADAVFTVNESIADVLARRYGIERPTVVPNVPRYAPAAKTDYLREWAKVPAGDLLLVSQGHLKPGRGSGLLLQAIALVPGAHVVFLGDGPLKEALLVRAGELGVEDRVHFHPFVPPDELLSVTASADIGVCLIEPLTESLRLSLPNKLFEYLRAGIPVLASDLPEIGRVVREFDVGLVVASLSAKRVAAAISAVETDRSRLKHWAANTPRVFETFQPEKASEAFCNRILHLLSSP